MSSLRLCVELGIDECHAEAPRCQTCCDFRCGKPSITHADDAKAWACEGCFRKLDKALWRCPEGCYELNRNDRPQRVEAYESIILKLGWYLARMYVLHLLFPHMNTTTSRLCAELGIESRWAQMPRCRTCCDFRCCKPYVKCRFANPGARPNRRLDEHSAAESPYRAARSPRSRPAPAAAVAVAGVASGAGRVCM